MLFLTSSKLVPVVRSLLVATNSLESGMSQARLCRHFYTMARKTMSWSNVSLCRGWFRQKHTIVSPDQHQTSVDAASHHVSSLVLKEPECDLDFLLNPDNLTLIKENIVNRKGIGDIELVHRLWRDCQSENDPTQKSNLHRQLLASALDIPNMSHPGVPIGEEDCARQVGLLGSKREFSFTPKTMVQLGEDLRMLRTDNVSMVTGNRTYFLVDKLALLEQALVQFTLAHLISKGFQLISVPDLLNPQIVERCGFMTTGDITQVYKLDPQSHGDICLAGTSEMALAGYFLNEVLDPQELPANCNTGWLIIHIFRQYSACYVMWRTSRQILLTSKLRLANQDTVGPGDATDGQPDPWDADPEQPQPPPVTETTESRRNWWEEAAARRYVKAGNRRIRRRTLGLVLLGMAAMFVLSAGTALLTHYFFLPKGAKSYEDCFGGDVKVPVSKGGRPFQMAGHLKPQASDLWSPLPEGPLLKVSPQFRQVPGSCNKQGRKRVTRQRRKSTAGISLTSKVNKENTFQGPTENTRHRNCKFKSLKFVADQTTINSVLGDVDITSYTDTEGEGHLDTNGEISDLEQSSDDLYNKQMPRFKGNGRSTARPRFRTRLERIGCGVDNEVSSDDGHNIRTSNRNCAVTEATPVTPHGNFHGSNKQSTVGANFMNVNPEPTDVTKSPIKWLFASQLPNGNLNNSRVSETDLSDTSINSSLLF